MQLILKSTSAFVRLPRELLSLPERANTASAAIRVAAEASMQGLLLTPCSAMTGEAVNTSTPVKPSQ